MSMCRSDPELSSVSICHHVCVLLCLCVTGLCVTMSDVLPCPCVGLIPSCPPCQCVTMSVCHCVLCVIVSMCRSDPELFLMSMCHMSVCPCPSAAPHFMCLLQPENFSLSGNAMKINPSLFAYTFFSFFLFFCIDLHEKCDYVHHNTNPIALTLILQLTHT